MRPPTSGIQASAAAMLEGNPVDCVIGLSVCGGVSGGGFGFGGIGSGAGPGAGGGGEVGSKGSAMVLLDEIERLFVK